LSQKSPQKTNPTAFFKASTWDSPALQAGLPNRHKPNGEIIATGANPYNAQGYNCRYPCSNRSDGAWRQFNFNTQTFAHSHQGWVFRIPMIPAIYYSAVVPHEIQR
jgi:hypothetical protein